MHYDPIECGMRIAHLRAKYGLTQRQTADKLNISVQHYRAVESGRRSASLELMVDISSIFHTSLDYLIVGKEPEARIVHLKQKLRAVITCLEEIEKTL
jgi:transcriptional regulator with XRE-family HTH domain